MKVQNNVKQSSFLGGDFVGGEMVWWRGDTEARELGSGGGSFLSP